MNKKTYRIGLLVCLSVFVFLTGLMIYENVNTEPTQQVVSVNNEKPPVVEVETEKLLKPFNQDIKAVRYFYEKDDEASRQSSSLVYFEGVYRPNQGMDFAKDDTTFEVVASLSGKVINKKDDPIFGTCLVIESSEGVVLTYQSLTDVKVELNSEVKQGDIIASSGENIYEADLGNHLHFIVEKDGIILNPEKCFDKAIDEI